jgi:protein transport protein SEC20
MRTPTLQRVGLPTDHISSCRPLLRKAQVSAKNNLRLAQKRERELLWASFSHVRSSRESGASSPRPLERPRRKPRSEMSKDELAVASSGDVTQALRRTHDMMAAELSRSDFARKTLQESTAALAQLGESYSSLDTMLSSSRDLLSTLMTSQKSDTWYLETSFYMLAVTNLWLVFRRFLYGPLWWLVWLPLRLLFRGAVTVTGIGKHGGSDGVVVDSSAGKPVQPEMNNEDIPTLQVEQPSEPTESPINPTEESLVEEISRMIDESKDVTASELVEELQKVNELADELAKESSEIVDEHEIVVEPELVDEPQEEERNEYKELLDREVEISRQEREKAEVRERVEL